MRVARAKEQVELSFRVRHRAAAALGEAAKRRRTGAGANHHDIGLRIIGHQEG